MHLVDGSCGANDIVLPDLLWLCGPVIFFLWPAPARTGDTNIMTFLFDVHPTIPWYINFIEKVP